MSFLIAAILFTVLMAIVFVFQKPKKKDWQKKDSSQAVMDAIMEKGINLNITIKKEEQSNA